MTAWHPSRLRSETDTEPIVGFRAWRLVLTPDGARIAPTTPRPSWPPHRAEAAGCTGSHTRLYMVFDPTATPHRSPDKGCTCGWHAVRDASTLVRPGGPAAVVGQVSLWGRVIEHARGFRAEYAYPARLRLVCTRCMRTGRWPAVPSVVGVRNGAAEPSCDGHARHVTRTSDVTLDAKVVEHELLDAYAVELLPVGALPRADRVDVLTRMRRSVER
jgi:hypothetical protein